MQWEVECISIHLSMFQDLVPFMFRNWYGLIFEHGGQVTSKGVALNISWQFRA